MAEKEEILQSQPLEGACPKCNAAIVARPTSTTTHLVCPFCDHVDDIANYDLKN